MHGLSDSNAFCPRHPPAARFGVMVLAGLALNMMETARGQSLGNVRPQSYRPAVGSMSFTTVDDAEIVIAPPAEGLGRVFIRARGTQENLHDVKPVAGSVFSVPLDQPGATIVGVDHRSGVVNLTQAAFDELRQDWTPTGEATTPQQPRPGSAKDRSSPNNRSGLEPGAPGGARVQFIESFKILLEVSDPAAAGGGNGPATGGGAGVITSKTGQPVEIRLLADPHSAPMGSDIPFCVYVDGDKKADATVRLAVKPAEAGGAPAARSIVADRSGSGHFRLEGAGQWTLEFREVAAAREREDVDWIARRAVVTFEISGGGR